MSAEVILMNKNGIAIAADSAVTIGNKTKIYNTADKMFTLSKYAPVGILIYNNSFLMGIQLELIIKEYRKKLGDKKFDTLEEYSNDFMKFCIQFTNEYSGERGQIELISWNLFKVCDFIFMITSDIIGKEISKGNISNDDELMKLANLKINEIISREKINFNNEIFDDQYYNAIIEKIDIENIIKLSSDAYKIKLENEVCTKLANKLKEIVKNTERWDTSNYTGIAITGYGEKEIFPSCIQIEVLGIINNKVIKNLERKYVITHEQISNIIPLAQTDVMNEFFLGVNDELEKIYSNIFEYRIKEKKAVDEANELRSIQEEMKAKKKKVVDERRENIHMSLSFLPRDEMIYMAEGMINLTSFKRRLVLDNYSETVGGPIDIAYISKGDGFIWIKRKKYFEKDMNYVFMENYFKEKGE